MRRIPEILVAVLVSLGATADDATGQRKSTSPLAIAQRFRLVSVGQHFSCGLSGNGEAFCWGANYYGQLGSSSGPGIAPCDKRLDLNSTCARLPVRVAPTRTFWDLDAGLKHVCATGTDSTAWCWGRNDEGQLGAATSTTCAPTPTGRNSEFTPSPCSFEPVKVEGLPPVRLVAAADEFSCALTWDDGVIYCWGGAAGDVPRRVSGSERFMRISAGHTELCADSNDSRVACWSIYDRVSDVKWMTVPGGLSRVVTHGHSCAIGAENRAYCWGFGASGSLGTGSTSSRERPDTPTLVAGNRKFVGIAVSFLGTCANELAASALYCWGTPPATPQPDKCFSGGEFGGTHECATTPQPVFPKWHFGPTSLSVTHACSVMADHAYCWGANNFGEVGNGTTRLALKEPQLAGFQAAGGGDSESNRRRNLGIGFIVVVIVLAARRRRRRKG